MVDSDGVTPHSAQPRASVPRRALLAAGPGAVVAALASPHGRAALAPHLSMLQSIEAIPNPLAAYPNRDWEDVYRDLYRPDSTYHYLCAPNDTHGCLLKASVKNGVAVYADPSFGYHRARDIYGNTASSRWDPRACVSGLAYVRRAYSDRRVKGCYVRKGFRDWVDAGMPRGDDGQPPLKYRSGRGKESFVKVTHEEAADLAARVYTDVARTYSGPDGARRLEEQGYYEPEMIEAMHGAGTQTLKFRGGMPCNAPFRIGGFYRLANMMALLDVAVRDVDPSESYGGRHWDSFSWHTDLPPGHPMVTGQQAMDFDLNTAENAGLITLWGMNWIATKMPDGHWLTEARLHGAKVVTIAPEYQSSSCKADRAITIRAGADSALAFGLAHVIVRDRLYDTDFVTRHTDLPLLVRTDTKKLLQARDLIAGYTSAPLRTVRLVEPGVPLPPPAEQPQQFVPADLREEWGDQVVWNTRTGAPAVVTHDMTGINLPPEVEPALEGTFTVTLADGSSVEVRPVFDAVAQYLRDTCSPEQISKVTWVPVDAIEELAVDIAANSGRTLFVTGMGPNHFFNNDNKDRGVLLVAALTDNIGHYGGTVGSFSGNYRLPNFSGIAQWSYEDPFAASLDPAAKAKVNKRLKAESAHFYNYGDRPLKVGKKMFTGHTHMPTPTKTMHFANSNSLLGNAKGAHDVFVNTLPKIEMIIHHEWYWTASCEYADIVFGVDSWPERQLPDVYSSMTNPFLQAWPSTPMERIHPTLDDMECNALVAAALSEQTGDPRFADYWRFVAEGRPGVYIQRVFDAGNATRGYSFDALHESCRNGTPFLTLMRTYPRIPGWEQTNESKPWYTKSGRLEFYRDEDEFIEYGENLPLHREPVDGTVYEPGVIMAAPHPFIDPVQPSDYGLDPDDLSTEVRQVRHVVRTPEEIVSSEHPLRRDGFSHVLVTPKFRHACHSMGASTDADVLIFGPFGDFYRHDKRKPWMSEGYVDLHPDDAEELGVRDGDYVWVDADPADRPFKGWQDNPDDYHVFRWMVRARVNPSVVRKVARAWFHFHVATHGSVQGHEERDDGLARNPRTDYQAGYRYGSHQSVTRAWLRPTLMTDSLTRKEGAGQLVGQGFELDVYGAVGAPKESFVKFTKAEDGGEDGEGSWYPAEQGYRPGSEKRSMQRYLEGGFITTGKG
ncbi:MAG: molybdopterin oxidoreductase [Acidimicrobiia bacterium]|nr:MAG: molybdopterin oxidoreductase [Acidimicrobiia bacterium]